MQGCTKQWAKTGDWTNKLKKIKFCFWFLLVCFSVTKMKGDNLPHVAPRQSRPRYDLPPAPRWAWTGSCEPEPPWLWGRWPRTWPSACPDAHCPQYASPAGGRQRWVLIFTETQCAKTWVCTHLRLETHIKHPVCFVQHHICNSAQVGDPAYTS